MLTKHDYKSSEVILVEGKIFNCCRNETPDDPKCTDCCYDTWYDELKRVNQDYSKVKEESDQLQKQLDFLTDRRNKLKKWLDELDDAEEKTRRICLQLELIAVQSDRIWLNSCKAVEAIEILFCMLRDFYMQVDYIKKRYDDLQNCIAKNNDSSLVKGQGILKCLDDYYAKLDVVLKTRDEIIKLIVDAIKISNLLRNNISTKECPSEDSPTDYNPCDPEHKPCEPAPDGTSWYGFKTIICEWYSAFNCVEKCQGEKDQAEQNPQKQVGYGIPVSKPESEECELEPIFEFPICNDAYKVRVVKWFNKDDKEVKDLSQKLNEKNKQKEGLLACKQSLKNAIDVVDPKSRC